MSVFVSLLRGINVGSCWIKMPALKSTFERLGYENVKTYLQSGNVVFSAQGQPEALAESIRQAIRENFTHDIPVLVLPGSRLIQIARSNPLLKRPDLDESFFHATILAETPKLKLPDSLPQADGEEAMLKSNVLYLYCPHGYGRTRLHNNYFERVLKVPATTRNWRTIRALVDLVEP